MNNVQFLIQMITNHGTVVGNHWFNKQAVQDLSKKDTYSQSCLLSALEKIAACTHPCALAPGGNSRYFGPTYLTGAGQNGQSFSYH